MAAKKVRTYEEFPGVEWIPGSGDHIKINDRCSACCNCVSACPGECFEVRDKKVVVKSLDKCWECGYCWFICPDDAIEFSMPKGGTGYRAQWG